ncbi:hypothetical protein DICVIV_11368 [Dictyocaulus viviparus]|uniref:Uncharacterized protein n=1 Tax=Dictyocaulus viviparus TaxID=29172 RepID=A0A0D8XG05_DICVI|nr:hypothetical protein DICVIV_11368 [Dictyocaulus viviparus]
MEDDTLVRIAKLPAGLRYKQITVENKYVAYCSGKEVFVLPTEENSSTSATSFTFSASSARSTSHVSQKGIHDSSYTLHWHKVAPSIALTPFGSLLSAGAETVLCKFTLSGAGRPSMLPRLGAPVRDIAISTDASHLALIFGILIFPMVSEDNTLHVVLTSTMTILSSMQTVVTCERSFTTVFTTDPCMPGTVVMNGKPGSLQWIQCADTFTLRQVSFSLENVADGDMSFAGIIQTFPDVEQVFFSNTVVVTLERLINFDEDHKRLRFWERSSKDLLIVRIRDSFMVSKDTISISGCKNPLCGDDKIFITTMGNGKADVWITCEEENRFKLDPVRQIDRHQSLHCASSIHNKMWAAAYSGGEEGTDVVTSRDAIRERIAIYILQRNNINVSSYVGVHGFQLKNSAPLLCQIGVIRAAGKLLVK